MKKTILITGATDGIGLETAKLLSSEGHDLLLHGRSLEKLESLKERLSSTPHAGEVRTYLADFSRLSDVESLADAVSENHDRLDVLINNAGVFVVRDFVTPDGLDPRFAVNTVSPFLLTKRLLPLLGTHGRVVNLSSAAQSTVDLRALAGNHELTDGNAYAQSKLALTMWSRFLGQSLQVNGPMIVAVNPGSMLGSKMVKDAYGVDGGDLSIGANILRQAALSGEFADAFGLYFDNDAHRFAEPHPDALDENKCREVIAAIESVLESHLAPRSKAAVS